LLDARPTLTGPSTRGVVSLMNPHRPSHELALAASFAALIAVLGVAPPIALFGNAVPITLQTLGVMLAGSLLGWRRGLTAVLVFLALVAAGLPLLAGGRGGLGVFAGPSAGYLVGFPVGAAVIGWIVERRLPGYSVGWGIAANVIGGIVVVYAFGVPVQAAVTHTSGLASAAWAALVFLPGDGVKAVVAAVVTVGVHRGYPAAPFSSRHAGAATVTSEPVKSSRP
jgi:biotin transport system substrate-specific component